MKNIKQNITRAILVLFVLTAFTACDETGDTNPGGTSVEKMAGDWYVQTLVDGEVLIDYKLLSTYNTAANNGSEMWIDDHKGIYWFKFKTPVNIEALTFTGSNLASSVIDDDSTTPDVIETYDINVNITNGKIIKNGATSTGGHTVDAISFDAEFSDDPGTIYQIVGYRRTGFLEDEH